MAEVIENLRAFADGGFSFPDHTGFIWAAYAVSFFVLFGLFEWTHIQSKKQKKLAKKLNAARSKAD